MIRNDEGPSSFPPPYLGCLLDTVASAFHLSLDGGRGCEEAHNIFLAIPADDGFTFSESLGTSEHCVRPPLPGRPLGLVTAGTCDLDGHEISPINCVLDAPGKGAIVPTPPHRVSPGRGSSQVHPRKVQDGECPTHFVIMPLNTEA